MINVQIYFPEREDDSSFTPATLAVLPREGEEITLDPSWNESKPPVRRYKVQAIEHVTHPKRIMPVKVYLL